MSAQAGVLVGAGAVALGVAVPWALILGLAVAVIAGGAGQSPDRGVRLILRDRRPTVDDWLLERWERGTNITTINQLMPFYGEALFARFKDSVIATLATAPLPRRAPGTPKVIDLTTLRILLQEEFPIGSSGFTLFLYDPARDTLIRRAVDQMSGELLLRRFDADIINVLRPRSEIPGDLFGIFDV